MQLVIFEVLLEYYFRQKPPHLISQVLLDYYAHKKKHLKFLILPGFHVKTRE